MTISAWTIYWITRLDEISILLTISFVLIAIVTVFFCFSWVANRDDYERQYHNGVEKQKTAVGLLKWLVPVLIAVGLTNALIPNTKQAAAMYVLPAIVNSDAVQQLPGELTILAREWLHELRPSQASKKDSK